MENKDNVLVQNQETEQATQSQTVTAQVSAGKENGSAVFRKFKDVNALAEAYGALEAEFTRRSQRLKELERRLAQGAEMPSKETAGEKGAEMLEIPVDGQVCADKEQEAVQPDQKVGDGEKMVEDGRRSAEMTAPENEQRGQGYGKTLSSDGEKAHRSVVAPSAESAVLGLSDDEIYRIASENEGVRIKIVGEYLASLKSAGVPLVRGGVGTVATPPSRARSVSEAGNMALRFFQTTTV